jgi:DNA polymerase-3 subunit chi
MADAPDAPAPDGRPEASFYHLTAQPLERAVSDLLEKCRGRGWRVTLRAGSAERVAALSALLWTYRDDSFLAHGDPTDPWPGRQPIYLTAGPETPNDPQALMLVDGAPIEAAEFASRPRTLVVFDGADEAAVAAARGQWRLAVGAGVRAVYWAQDEAGRWVRKAASGE